LALEALAHLVAGLEEATVLILFLAALRLLVAEPAEHTAIPLVQV